MTNWLSPDGLMKLDLNDEREPYGVGLPRTVINDNGGTIVNLTVGQYIDIRLQNTRTAGSTALINANEFVRIAIARIGGT